MESGSEVLPVTENYTKATEDFSSPFREIYSKELAPIIERHLREFNTAYEKLAK